MNLKPQFLLVNHKALPDVYKKVLDAKQLLAKGQADTSSEACKMVGISRSAYYKYRDSVFAYEDNAGKAIVTLGLKLHDMPGVLSSVLMALYHNGANLLTVNQNIPNDAVANVTVSVRVDEDSADLDQILSCIGQIDGVIDIKTI